MSARGSRPGGTETGGGEWLSNDGTGNRPALRWCVAAIPVLHRRAIGRRIPGVPVACARTKPRKPQRPLPAARTVSTLNLRVRWFCFSMAGRTAGRGCRGSIGRG